MRNFAQKIFQVVIALIISANFAFAQNEFGGVIKFDKTIHDFGDILLSDGAQHCKFIFTNISDKPIVLHRVITSCGCTEPDWDKKPLRPGENGEIRITFKNDQGPYPFDKVITVYVSDLTKPVLLRIRGVAHQKKKSMEELYPERFGVLGFKSKTMSLGQIEQGLSKNHSAEFVNLSGKSVKVSFKGVTPGLTISAEPAVVPARGKAKITYVVDTKKTQGKLWGQSQFKAGVVVNGVLQKGELVVEALVKENFSDYSEQQMKSGALPKFLTSSASFEKCKAGEKQKVSFTFTNMGKETMKIYKVESSEPGCTFKYPEVVAASERGVIEVTVDTSKGKGEMLYVISLITNAPTRPIVNLFITGEIEK